MKEKIRTLIKEYIQEYSTKKEVKTGWEEPIVQFADADDKMFMELKEVVSPTHFIPQDFLEGAQTVISYFIPFSQSVVNSNIEGNYSSREWAIAYIETNELISNLNDYINQNLASLNYQSKIIPATHNFDEESLMSNWSHRHVAYIAGLGKFGLNNMLITDRGCCGRVGSIITDLKIEATRRSDQEYCLYKSKGLCKRCVQNCVNGALKIDSFDRHKCYEILLENNRLHTDLDLTDVCGKCSVNLPCSFINPAAREVR